MKETKLTNIEKKERLSPVNLILSFVIGIYCLTVLFGLIWAILSSLKTGADFMDNTFGFPTRFRFQNFTEAFASMRVSVGSGASKHDVYLPQMFLNTLIYSLGTCTVFQFSRCVCAYIAAKHKTSYVSKILVTVVVVVMIIPITGTLAAEIRIKRLLCIYDNLLLGIIFTSGFTGQAFLIYYAAFNSVSFAYAEAAEIDGANSFVIFFKIMFPMVINMFGGLFLLEFIALWNNYTTPMVFYPSYPTVALGLYTFYRSRTPNPNAITVKLASSIVVALPIVILYMVFSKKLIGNISIGGLKG